jgi:hypothetical protein
MKKMKSLFIVSILLAGLSIAFYACQRETNEPGPMKAQRKASAVNVETYYDLELI